MGKLTNKQRALLEMIADPVFRIGGLSVYGPREYRTAKSLHTRGLADLSVFDKLKITEAGRTALSQGAPDA